MSGVRDVDSHMRGENVAGVLVTKVREANVRTMHRKSGLYRIAE